MLLLIHWLLSHGSELAVAILGLEKKTKIGQFSIAPVGFYPRLNAAFVTSREYALSSAKSLNVLIEQK